MEKWELIAPCHFGLEAVLKREILDLGYEISKVEDGKVTFWGDAQAVADANVFIRTAERILIKVGEVHAETFEELFQGTKDLPWENYIPEDGKFWVAKANSIKSKLFSPSVYYEKSNCGEVKRCLWHSMVRRGGRVISHTCCFYERCGYDRSGHFRGIFT